VECIVSFAACLELNSYVFCCHYYQKQQHFRNYKSVSQPDDLHNEVDMLLAASSTWLQSGQSAEQKIYAITNIFTNSVVWKRHDTHRSVKTMAAKLYVKLHRCIVCNAYNTVFDSKHSAICVRYSILPLLVLLTHMLQQTVTWVNSGTSPWLRDLMRLCQRSLKIFG